MAIFSKKKNKKDGSRNSVLPAKEALTGDDSSSSQQRQVSGTSTISSTNSLVGTNQPIANVPHNGINGSPNIANVASTMSNLYSGSNQGGPYPPTRTSGGISPQTSNNAGSNSRSNSAMSGNGPSGNGGFRSPLGLRSATSPAGQQYPGGGQWGSQGGHPQQSRQPLHHQQSVPGGLRSPATSQQSPHPSTQPQYPWSRHHIANSSPFPRHGHAANAVAARDGEVFVMGGLKGSNVFGDLWVIETGTYTPLRGAEQRVWAEPSRRRQV